MWKYNYDELFHYGIKGMRWGVRRSKEELQKQRIGETMMREALSTGGVSKIVNDGHQKKHLNNPNNYVKGRSYLLVDNLKDAQNLINNLSGTGSAVINKGTGEWVSKERVKSPRIIGVYVNKATGENVKTRNAMIVYSKDGAHIYPRKE